MNQIRKSADVNAATLTDEQIRELIKAHPSDAKILKAATCALGLSRGGIAAAKRARARCAEILNAKAAR